MKQDKTLKRPHEAPNGYFDGFNERVMQKVGHDKGKKFQWHVKRSFLYAAAAMLAIIGIGLYKMLNHSEIRVNKIVNTSHSETLKDTITPEIARIRDENLLQYLEEETVAQTTVTPPVAPASREDLSIEEELEAEGLIVRDLETEWLSENEIIP
jgi:hypothetical protein